MQPIKPPFRTGMPSDSKRPVSGWAADRNKVEQRTKRFKRPMTLTGWVIMSRKNQRRKNQLSLSAVALTPGDGAIGAGKLLSLVHSAASFPEKILLTAPT